MRIIKLGCVSCGAALDITSDANRFSCGFCGTQHIVERDGGTVAVRAIPDSVSKVHAGADKTAAELALVRLDKEVVDLNKKKTRLQQAPLELSPATNYFMIGAACIFGIGFFVAWAYIGSCAMLVLLPFLALLGSFLAKVIGVFGAFVELIAGMSYRDRQKRETIKRIIEIDKQILKKKSAIERYRKIVGS